uniref:Uncharacterized protein n=1 Tax=Alexandrium catenella TaxID=2925 RepID=A0A7S1S8W6_ALECA
MPAPRSLMLSLGAGLALLAAAAPAAEEALGQPPSSTLDLDDECAAEGGGHCALNAMQLRRSADLGGAERAEDQDHPSIDHCNDSIPAKACPARLKCVTKADGSWSQCVDCSLEVNFQKDCILMNADMREAAIAKCGFTCPFTTPKPLEAGCNDSVPELACKAPSKCATTADGSWSQCVDCSRRFYKDCQSFKDDVRLAAIKTCRRTCQGTMCRGPEWCRHPYKCAGNLEWSQCINCHSRKTFTYSCLSWKPAFREEVEKVCHHECKR